jgi:radical SAM protein with 4Fe4S-binding SPASM domain
MPGQDYFDQVRSNLRRLHRMKEQARSALSIRASFLLFEENSSLESIAGAVEELAPYCDCIRFSVPQDRNDGGRVGNVPMKPRELLAHLEERFAGHPKVRVLTSTAAPKRDTTFRLCRAQRFQAVIDRCGNVFPCPQVALAEYQWLNYGNIRGSSIREILLSERRRTLFQRDVTSEMKCRICDRKDEAINVTLDRLFDAFPSENGRYGA